MLWWMQMAILVYMFYMSKYVEFMDTVRANSCADVTFLQVKIYVRFVNMVQANSCVHVLHVKICQIHGYGKSSFLCTWYAFTCENMSSSWIQYEPILVYSFSHVKMCWIYGYCKSKFLCSSCFYMSKCVEFMDMVRPNFVMYIILHVKIIHEYGKIQFLCTCENILKSWDTIRFNSLCMCFTCRFFVYMFFVLVLPFCCFVLPRSLVLIWKPCIDLKEKF
jgi:hypothetical protein